VRWRPAALAAAGVVAAIGLSSQQAGAEPVEEDAPDPVEQAARAQIREVGAAVAASKSAPTGDGPVRPEVKVLSLEAIETVAPAVVSEVVAPMRSVIRDVLVAPTAPRQFIPATRTGTVAPQLPPIPVPLTAAPVDDPVGQTPAPAPIPPSAVTISPAPTVPATPPGAVAPVTAGDAWYPHEVAEMADQRIAERMRSSPVRGPPPTTATALGNDARNTTTQVAVVRGPSGTSVAISSQSQTATVHNVGVATADGPGGGSATATGNTADTSITQVSVVVQRGSGSATVEQEAKVDNVGVASAASNGAGNATAVGNDSATNVTQIAVVYIEGSGDAHVSQTTDVANVGVASATATGRDATAVGNTSTTDVTQIAVVHVGDEDVTVGQTSTTHNIGVGVAIGGTATGNTAVNTDTQVVKVSR
jgi:hypothetical protein